MHNNDDVDPADGVDPGDVHEHDVWVRCHSVAVFGLVKYL
jgi:hypothetical protein